MSRTAETVAAFAAAKVNLTLHVTGRRADGYHLLDSLVVFVGVGDRLSVRAAPSASLTVTGPRAAGVPADAGNLVARAAALFPETPAGIVLDKHLPAAAGIGGGSSDAAACLVALAALTGRPLPPEAEILALGADVPVCLGHAPRRMRGVGERLDPVPPLPPLHAVLANPGVAVPTPAVFAALVSRDNPPMADLPAQGAPAEALAAWLAAQRNDLEPAALALAPGIGAALAALARTPGCLLARMSGSGATCVGLYAAAAGARAAAAALRAERPGWWVADGPVLSGGDPVSTAAALS